MKKLILILCFILLLIVPEVSAQSIVGYQQGYARNKAEALHEGLWDGLVGCWASSLGISGAVLRDQSGKGNHGSFTGDLTWSIEQGKQSITADGTNDAIDLGSEVDAIGTSDFTIVAWVKMSKSAPDETIVAAGNTAAGDLLIYKASTNGYRVLSSGGSGISMLSTDYIADEWVQVVVRREGSTAKLYLNADQKAQDTSASDDITSTDWWIHAASGTVRDASSPIGDICYYNRALTQSEIQQLYVDQSALFRRKPQVYYSSIEDSGNIILEPDAQTLTLSQPSPTITIDDGISLSAQSLTLAQPALAVDLVSNVSIKLNDLVLTLAQPELDAITAINAIVEPDAQTLTLDQPSPTITIDDGISLSAQTLTLDQPSPTITIDDGISLSAQSLTLSQPALAVDLVSNVSLELSAQSLTLSQPAPVLSLSTTYLASAQNLTLTLQEPDISTTIVSGDIVDFTLYIDQERDFTSYIDQERTFNLEF